MHIACCKEEVEGEHRSVSIVDFARQQREQQAMAIRNPKLFSDSRPDGDETDTLPKTGNFGFPLFFLFRELSFPETC